MGKLLPWAVTNEDLFALGAGFDHFQKMLADFPVDKLTDYLNGDTYYKIHREHHNLDRARNQFKLVADITRKEKELAEITAKCC